MTTTHTTEPSPAWSPSRRARLGFAAMAVAMAPLVSCGGGEDDSADTKDESPAESTTSESTTTESTTTTAAPRGEADRVSKDLANAGALQTADFGDGWTEYSAGERWTPSEESCNFVEGGGPEEGLLDGAVVTGPTVQLGEQASYVSSRAYAFPTEADAVAWVEIAKGDEWANCWLEYFQQAYFPDDEATMRVDTRDNEALGQDGFEAVATFVGENDEGEATIFTTKGVFRLGRTVIVANTEDAVLGENQPLYDGQQAALSAAYDRVNALG